MLELTCKVRITNVKYKTVSKLFKDIEVGDIVTLSLPLKNNGRNYRSGTSYQPRMEIIIEGKGVIGSSQSLNNVATLFYELFDYEAQ